MVVKKKFLLKAALLLAFNTMLFFIASGFAPGMMCIPGSGSVSGGTGGGSNTAPVAPTPVPQQDVMLRVYTGEYSYKENCTTRLDPIGIVVRYNGQAIEDHVIHHGVTVKAGSLQEFIDFERCVEGERSTATNDGVKECFGIPCGSEERMHIRANIVESIFDGTGTQRLAVSTPHHDHAVTCGHSSTFTDGKEFFKNVLVQGGHRFMGEVWWGNAHSMRQCDGRWSSGNGFVYHIDGR